MKHLPSELCSLIYRLRESGCSYDCIDAQLQKILPNKSHQRRIPTETLVCVYISERDRRRGRVTIHVTPKTME